MKNAKFLEISCPACNTVYRIPIEYCSKDAICANEECGVMFSIPSMNDIEKAAIDPEETHPQEEYSTSTVRIERLKDSTGMIPEPKLKEGFDTSDFIMMEKEQKKKRKIFRL